ncbi:MAG: acyltransferase family protein [Deltaproteobacteria bacterium]|nr:acyltransferase family protein [Deltaproteobacteria bacterium]
MARKVLGNDPFGGDSPKPATASAKKPAPPAKKSAAAATKGKKTSPPPVKEEAPATTPSEVAPAPAPTPTSPAPSMEKGVGAEIEEPSLESVIAQLDALLDQARDPAESRPLLDRLASRLKALTQPDEERALAPAPAAAPVLDDEPFDAARELLGSDYYLRRWGQTAIRDRSEEVDDFGLDPEYARRWQPVWDLLYDRWWRVEVEGIENVPTTGRVALVANHSGAIPLDGIMLATALRKEHPGARPLRWLAEDFIFHFPFAGAYLNRLGAVRACQENAERLLRKDACLALFPEGVKGIAKPFRERYQLQRFGRGGHIKLAIRTGTPIVPVTIVGAEETWPMLFQSGRLSKMLGLPFVPITPTFPLLGPLGLAGLPARWKIVFGEPIAMDAYRPEQSEDIVLVNRLNEKLRETIQGTLDRLLRARQSVFKG